LFASLAIVAMLATAVPTTVLGAASYSDELQGAYDYAYGMGVTTQSSIENANMYGSLIRSHMAKMMVKFAKEVYGRTADTSLACEFTDVANQSDEMKGYITEACQMGLMGVGITAFNPNGTVTRAQFGTVLSRVLYGDTYNVDTNPYYADHLQALKDAGIMTMISNPDQLEVRGYVMLMMQRADEGVATPEICTTPENVLSCSLGLDSCPAECKTVQENKVGTLTVASTDASYTSIPKVGAVKHATVKFTAGSDDVNVYGVNMKKLALTNTSNVKIWLEKDGVRVTTQAAFSDDKAVMSFLTALAVKAWASESLDLYVQVNTTAGSEYQFASTYIDSSAETVNGTITTPNLRTADYTLATVNFAPSTPSATSYKVDADRLVELGVFKLTTTLYSGNNTENLYVKSAAFTNDGTLSLTNVSDLAIYRDDAKVSTKTTVDGRNVTFLLDDQIKYTLSTANYTIKGKITAAERINDGLQFRLKNVSNVQVLEQSTNFRATMAGSSLTLGSYTINGADVKFNQPLGTLTKSIVPGTLGAVFYTGTITALARVNLDNLAVIAQTSVSGLNDIVRTFYLKVGNSVLSAAAPTGTTGLITFEGTVTIEWTVPFMVYADIRDTAPATTIKFQDNINLSKFVGTKEYASNWEALTWGGIGSLSPITNNVVSASLQWSNTISSAKTVQRNDRNVELANVEFSTTTDIISKVYSFQAQLTGAAFTGHDKYDFAGGTVTVYDASNNALVSATIINGQNTLNFVLPSGVNVSKNNPVTFKVKLDQVANSTVSGNSLQLTFNGAVVNAKNFITNNPIYPAGTLSSVMVNVKDAGTVNVVSQSFTNKLVKLNGSTAVIGNVKFHPYNGDAILKTLTLSGLDVTKVTKVVMKDSGSLVATFVKSGTVLYVDNVDQTILADTTKLYDVEATFMSASTANDLLPNTITLTLQGATFESNNGASVTVTPSLPQPIGGTCQLIKDIPTITAIAGIKGSNYATYKVTFQASAGETRINKLVLALGNNLTSTSGAMVNISTTENGATPSAAYGTSVVYSSTVTFSSLDITVDNTNAVTLYINVKNVTWSSANNTPYINIGLSDLDYSDVFSDATQSAHTNMLLNYKAAMTDITDLGKNIQ